MCIKQLNHNNFYFDSKIFLMLLILNIIEIIIL